MQALDPSLTNLSRRGRREGGQLDLKQGIGNAFSSTHLFLGYCIRDDQVLGSGICEALRDDAPRSKQVRHSLPWTASATAVQTSEW